VGVVPAVGVTSSQDPPLVVAAVTVYISAVPVLPGVTETTQVQQRIRRDRQRDRNILGGAGRIQDQSEVARTRRGRAGNGRSDGHVDSQALTRLDRSAGLAGGNGGISRERKCDVLGAGRELDSLRRLVSGIGSALVVERE
jgi:hypothetical protein